MGTRYYLTVGCNRCGRITEDVYYAPTCGFTTFECKCGNTIDLEEYTGISYEDASSLSKVKKEVKRLLKEYKEDAESSMETPE